MPYKPKTRFELKDGYAQNDPRKVIYGSEFAVEFEAISATFSDVQGGFDEVKDKLESGGYSMEEAPAGGAQYGRQEKNGKMTWTEIGSAGSVTWSEVSGKPSTFPPSPHNHDGQYVKTETDPTVPAHVKGITQADIDGWNASGSGGASTWDELTGKPTEFPPESHTHEIDDVNGLQGALDAAGGTPAWDDVTGKPSTFPPEAHNHQQSEVDGLELRLTSIEDSITSGGGFVDAPDDGKLYGRQSEAWAEVVIPDAADPDWSDIQNKPTEFPPADHDQPWSSITDTPDDYPPSSHGHEIADVNGLQDALDNAGGVTYTLPVALRSGDAQLPLTLDGAKLAVMTRGGELELPLAA
jgi:hypothetical protein